MLEPAIKYEKELLKKLKETQENDIERYSYYDTSYALSFIGGNVKIEKNTIQKHQFVSVYKGEVIGYISYKASLTHYRVYDFRIINFTNNTMVFGLDLKRVLQEMFELYKFRKITFGVFIGNDIEKSYDRIVNSFHGRIVGIYKEHCKLADGKFHDYKLYEVLRSDYLKARGKDGSKNE
jgi:hypothetical protein